MFRVFNLLLLYSLQISEHASSAQALQLAAASGLPLTRVTVRFEASTDEYQIVSITEKLAGDMSAQVRIKYRLRDRHVVILQASKGSWTGPQVLDRRKRVRMLQASLNHIFGVRLWKPKAVELTVKAERQGFIVDYVGYPRGPGLHGDVRFSSDGKVVGHHDGL